MSQSLKLMAHKERQVEALNLRRAGHTYTEIAEILGYSNKSTAHRAVSTLIGRIESDSVESWRAMENERLDKMQVSIWPEATSGNLRAIDRMLHLMERRAKLNGLDMPVLQESHGEIILRVVHGDKRITDSST